MDLPDEATWPFLSAAEPMSSSWQPQDFAFDAFTMLGARLADAADEALLPLPAARVVTVPPAEAEDAAPAGAQVTRTKRRAAVDSGAARRPAVCRVTSCAEPLSATHSYCFRFRVCVMHLRAEVVNIDGQPSRFCQKCSCFHALSAFNGSNRTCIKALNSLRLRRPSRKAGPSASRSPPTSAAPSNGTASPATRGASAPYDDAAREAEELFRFVNSVFAGEEPAPAPGAPGPGLDAPAPTRSTGEASGDWDHAESLWAAGCSAAALPCAHEAWLKLDDATPSALPPSLAPALAHAWCDDGALSLEAAPRPGCTLLHLDALLPPDAPPPPGAHALARALLAGAAAPWLHTRRVAVHVRGETAVAEPGSAWGRRTARVTLSAAPVPQRPPRLLPLALLSTAPSTLRAPGWAGPPPGCELRLRLHGGTCVLRCDAGNVALPQLGGAEGAARLLLAMPDAPGGASRTVLLTRDPAVAAEVASLDASADGEAAERLLCVLGAALRPGCAPRVLAAAAAEALRRGWVATASRLLPPLRAALDADAADAAARSAARMLLHAAALSGRPALVRLVLLSSHECGMGTPQSPDTRGMTPLHFAASMVDGAVAEVLASASPAALLAWFYARNADGATPGDVATAAGGSAARLHVALALRLDSARPLVAELAAADGDGDEAALSGQGGSFAQPFDDLALARLLLRTYAPAAAGAPAMPSERRLYEAARMLRRRQYVLCWSFLTLLTVQRRLWLPPLTPELVSTLSLPGAQHSYNTVYTVYQAAVRTLPVYTEFTLLVNLAVLLFVGLPQLRGAYVRHGLAVMRTYYVFQSLLPGWPQWHVRRELGFVVRFPALAGNFVMLAFSTHLAFAPLPVRDIHAMLAARCALMALGNITGLPVWPVSTAPLFSGVVIAATSAAYAAILALVERRAWAAWRLGRRRKLAEGAAFAKQLTVIAGQRR